MVDLCKTRLILISSFNNKCFLKTKLTNPEYITDLDNLTLTCCSGFAGFGYKPDFANDTSSPPKNVPYFKVAVKWTKNSHLATFTDQIWDTLSMWHFLINIGFIFWHFWSTLQNISCVNKSRQELIRNSTIWWYCSP